MAEPGGLDGLVPLPRRAVVAGMDPERARRRHRLATARRQRQFSNALDLLLGIETRAADEIDYHATMLDRGVNEWAAAGQRGAA
jgi:hypothetical protein